MNPLKLPPTPAELSTHFAYDPETGVLVRRVSVHKARAGAVAGCSYNGYLRVGIKGRLYYVHRIIWAISHGAWPLNHIDHINGNPTDNRLQNLRLATNSENGRNSKKPRNNTSGYKGVFWYRRSGKWLARIMVSRRPIHLGLFTTIEDAAAAYAAASVVHHKEFARTE